MARWFVIKDAAGADVSAEVIAIHAALLKTGQILYFSGDEHDPDLNRNHDIDHTRIFDCSTFAVGTMSSPTSDVFDIVIDVTPSKVSTRVNGVLVDQVLDAPNLSTGKLIFLIGDKDEIGVSNFSFIPAK